MTLGAPEQNDIKIALGDVDLGLIRPALTLPTRLIYQANYFWGL
jgi:hypothetical protein